MGISSRKRITELNSLCIFPFDLALSRYWKMHRISQKTISRRQCFQTHAKKAQYKVLPLLGTWLWVSDDVKIRLDRKFLEIIHKVCLKLTLHLSRLSWKLLNAPISGEFYLAIFGKFLPVPLLCTETTFTHLVNHLTAKKKTSDTKKYEN